MKWLRPGYVVQLGGDLNELDRHTNITRPSGQVFVDDLKSAWDYKQKHPDVEVAHRWEKLEPLIPLHIAPEQWLTDRLTAFDMLGIPHDAIIIHTANEPNVSPQHATWEARFAKALLADPSKPRSLQLNFGVGKPKDSEIPLYRELLRLMVENPDRIYLGLHGYAPIVWTAGVNGSAPPGYNKQFLKAGDPQALEYPIARDEWFVRVFNNACWFMGRWRFWAAYCHQQFKKMPNIWKSESGFDDVKDVEWWQQSQPRPADPADKSGKTLKRLGGWKTLQLVWKLFWPQWDTEEVLWEQTDRYIEVAYESNFVAADGTVYESPVSVITLFGWSPMKWPDYDYSLAAIFKKLYEKHVAELPIVPTKPAQGVPKPVDARTPVTVQVTFSGHPRKLYIGPGYEYRPLGDIKSGDVMKVFDPTRILNNNTRWRWVEESPAGDGWFCIDDISFGPPPKPPAQEPEQPSADKPDEPEPDEIPTNPGRKERVLVITAYTTDEEWAQCTAIGLSALEALRKLAGLSDPIQAILPHITIEDMSQKEGQHS